MAQKVVLAHGGAPETFPGTLAAGHVEGLHMVELVRALLQVVELAVVWTSPFSFSISSLIAWRVASVVMKNSAMVEGDGFVCGEENGRSRWCAT